MVPLVKNPPANAGDSGDLGSIFESGRSLGVGNGTQASIVALKISWTRGAWWTIVHGVVKNQTPLSIHMLAITSEDFIIQEPTADGHFHNWSDWDRTLGRSPNHLYSKLAQKGRPGNLWVTKDSLHPLNITQAHT